jgi:hypothetical protein
MTQSESDLFQIRLNEEGKKFIRKFAAISYTMLVLVIFGSAVSIYWNIKMLTTSYGAFTTTLYNKTYPYVYILFSILAIVSNICYLRFPQVLLRSVKLNDEFGANGAFKLLFKGAAIFLFWLILSSAEIIWSLIIR